MQERRREYSDGREGGRMGTDGRVSVRVGRLEVGVLALCSISFSLPPPPNTPLPHLPLALSGGRVDGTETAT